MRSGAGPVRRAEKAAPPGVEIRRGAQRLTMSFPPTARRTGVRLVGMAALWCAGMLWIVMNGVRVEVLLTIGMLTLLMCVPLAWAGFALGFSRLHVEVDRSWIRVFRQPIPLLRRSRVSVKGLSQVIVEERQAADDGSVVDWDGLRFDVHDVVALPLEGRRVRIARFTDSKASALFLEQEIERFLGIQDRHVAGALLE